MTNTENNQPIEFNSALKLDANFQRACDEFVYRHIERNAGELIDMLLHIPDHEYMAHSEAAMDIAYRPLTADDYREQCSDSKITVNPLKGGFGGFYILGGEDVEYHEDIELFDNEIEAWESAYSYIGQDEPDRQEALEFWAVSDDLAVGLYIHGEPVDRDILGFSIWGRATSGQSISMDSVIQRIYWDRLDHNERASFIQKIGND